MQLLSTRIEKYATKEVGKGCYFLHDGYGYFEQLGYFIVDDAHQPGTIEEMREAARRIKNKVRSGEVDLYTDFHGEGEPYHIVGLNAPEFGEPIFAEYYGCNALLDYVHGQIGTDIRIGPMAMFTNPHNEPFNVRWHRDDGLVMDRNEGDELEYLRRPRSGPCARG